MINPHFSPMDAMIAQDFSRQRVPATESIAGTLVEGARARWREKDQRDKSAGQPICTAIAALRVASKDGRNERIQRSVLWPQSNIYPDNLLTVPNFPLTTSELVKNAG